MSNPICEILLLNFITEWKFFKTKYPAKNEIKTFKAATEPEIDKAAIPPPGNASRNNAWLTLDSKPNSAATTKNAPIIFKGVNVCGSLVKLLANLKFLTSLSWTSKELFTIHKRDKKTY